MSIDYEPSVVAWLPTVGPAVPQFVQRGGLLLPADLDVAPTAAPAAEPVDPEPEPVEEAGPGTDLQPRDQVTDLESVEVEPELVDADDEPLDDEPGSRWAWLRPRRTEADESADELARRLAADRAVIEVGRQDELARRIAAAEHHMSMESVAAQLAAFGREQAEQAKDEVEEQALAALHRHAATAGERARIAAEIRETGEMRALRIAKVQKISLWIGLVLLIGFGAWSTAGVHDGLVKLLHLQPGSALWWAGWALEPLLITIVAGLIVLRPVLRMSGGDVDVRARRAEVVALGGSLALNLFGGWTQTTGGWTESLAQAVAHSVGAIGAAGTAWLIGVVIDYTTSARPWDGAARVSELSLNPSGRSSATASAAAAGTGIKRGKRPAGPVVLAALPDDVRTLLLTVREAITAGLLPADPTGYRIYKDVMRGKGDRGRAGKVADLVAGWRPPLRAVDDVDSAAG
jgi:hypothetical protein